MKSHLTNKAKDVKENPFIKNKENIYSFKNNKNVNRSIEKRRNFKTQMSFRIERPNQRKINEANKNNFIGNKENIDNNLSIINYKSKNKNIIKKNNKTIDKKVSKLMIKSFQNIKVKEKNKMNKDNEIKKDKEKINYFDITKIENNVKISK